MRSYTDRSGRPSKDATIDHIGHREWQAQPYAPHVGALGDGVASKAKRDAGKKKFGVEIRVTTGRKTYRWKRWYKTERARQDAMKLSGKFWGLGNYAMREIVPL